METVAKKTREYLDNVKIEDLRESILDRTNFLYNNSSLNRWNIAGNIQEQNPAELENQAQNIKIEIGKLGDSYKTLTDEEQSKVSKDIDELKEKYNNLTEREMVNHLWSAGKELEELGIILLDDRYSGKVHDLFEITEGAEDYTSFRNNLAEVLSGWTFGETMTSSGGTYGFSAFRKRYLKGAHLLESGTLTYKNLENGRAKLEKKSMDDKSGAVFNNDKWTFTYA
jgi:hypothetical protein